MIYLITVNYHAAELIQLLLASIQSNDSIAHQVLIVNNSPNDQQLYSLASDTVHILEAGGNIGFGGGCNLGLQWVYERDPAAIVWLINPDTQLQPDSLQSAFQFCQTYPHLAIVGTLVREPDGQIWFASGEFNPTSGRIIARQDLPQSNGDYVETAWVTGCSLILQLKNFTPCPYFDSDYFLYYEDFDFCRRYAQLGYSIVIASQIQVIHQPSSITGRQPALKRQHATYSYLLTLEKHTALPVLLYRLTRILAYAIRVSGVEPETTIAIIKGVRRYLVRVSRFVSFPPR